MNRAQEESFALSGLVSRAELQYHLSRYQFASRYANGKHVLDIACGTGYGTRLLSHVAARVVGGDISLESVSSALRRYHAANVDYVCLDAQEFPFREGSFDVVVSLETVEHLVEAERFLDECVRVLRPGGTLVLSTPNKESHFLPLWIVQGSPLARRLLGRIPGVMGLLANPFHYKEFDYHELRGIVGSRLDVKGFYGISKLSQSWLYTRGIVKSGGIGRVWWEATKLAGFIATLLRPSPVVDVNGARSHADQPVDAAFIPFSLEGPGPVEYFIIIGHKQAPRSDGPLRAA